MAAPSWFVAPRRSSHRRSLLDRSALIPLPPRRLLCLHRDGCDENEEAHSRHQEVPDQQYDQFSDVSHALSFREGRGSGTHETGQTAHGCRSLCPSVSLPRARKTSRSRIPRKRDTHGFGQDFALRRAPGAGRSAPTGDPAGALVPDRASSATSVPWLPTTVGPSATSRSPRPSRRPPSPSPRPRRPPAPRSRPACCRRPRQEVAEPAGPPSA